MSPKPSLHKHTRTRTHEPSLRSPSMASTLRSPSAQPSFDSLLKPQLDAHAHTHHTHRSSRSTHKLSPTSSVSGSSATFPDSTTLPSTYHSQSHSHSHSHSDTHTTQSPLTLEFLNFLDDLGILMLCKPLLKIGGVEWVHLMDDVGVWCLCEPMGLVGRLLRRLGLSGQGAEKWESEKSRSYGSTTDRSSHSERDGRRSGRSSKSERRSSERSRNSGSGKVSSGSSESGSRTRTGSAASFIREKVID